MKIVIIGNGSAAVKALEAMAACQSVPRAEKLGITIISGENTAPYSPMFLVDYLTGELGEGEIRLGDGHGLSPRRRLGQRVVGVDDSRNRVVMESGREIGYDRLLIASGASPVRPSIKGIDKEGVHFFNRLGDVKRLSPQVLNAKKVIIIGAGAIGMELAIAFNKMGKDTLVVELLGQILPQLLDEDLARYVGKQLTGRGIVFRLGEGVSEVTGNKRAAGVVVGGREMPADLILFAVGLKPNIDFLESSRVKVNRGVLVDEKMRTNLPDIYAAGDVAESLDPYGRYELVFNWYNAVDQGWTAGGNIIGAENTCKASPGLVALKGTEPPVISIGRKHFENGYETLACADREKGVYEKVFMRDNHIDCYQAIGVVDRAGLVYSYIKERKDIGHIKDGLFDILHPASLAA